MHVCMEDMQGRVWKSEFLYPKADAKRMMKDLFKEGALDTWTEAPSDFTCKAKDVSLYDRNRPCHVTRIMFD